MKSFGLFILLHGILSTNSLNLDYLDPTKLQTRTAAAVQENLANEIISRYSPQTQNNYEVSVSVNPLLFRDKKDVFIIRTEGQQLLIKASTGVAAVWGFNYFLKKYCNSQIEWQTQRIDIPDPLPQVDEVVVANDRFRYYQNIHTASISFVWWSSSNWKSHVEWMALNGINLALAPVAQEAAWRNVYREIGMTDEEIDDHFTGPAFLSWLRMGSMHGWNGPLYESWHERQKDIEDKVVLYMFQLGMVPVLPTFSGHVPKAFARIYPNATFYTVDTSSTESDKDYCCNIFLHPSNPEFKKIGKMFLNEITVRTGLSHIYIADPFNELKILPWSTKFVQDTAVAIYTTLNEIDDSAVWMIPNWMIIYNPIIWPVSRVENLMTSVPNGRMLVLDIQSEQWPQYDTHHMYYGQPFIWCMLHQTLNSGGASGMFGNMNVINKDVYEVRARVKSTMIGIGLTPEGINQNYVMYDLMLETAWRKRPVEDLDAWVADYAERRYGCNHTASAWQYLLRSVYNFNGLNEIGKHVTTRRPSLRIEPGAWYSSRDLFNAYKKLIFVPNKECSSPGYRYDVVDVTRQALQYRAEQIYATLTNVSMDKHTPVWIYNATIYRFLEVMDDIGTILNTEPIFSAENLLRQARSTAATTSESYLYDLNARNQLLLWGQWSEMFHYYYIPSWRIFLNLALDANINDQVFDEKLAQTFMRSSVEEPFLSIPLHSVRSKDTVTTALELYIKWAFISGLDDLPNNVILPDSLSEKSLPDNNNDDNDPDKEN